VTTLRQRQRGAALLIALLVVALAVVIAAALLSQGEQQRARVRDSLRAEQSWQLMRGLEAWAADSLAARGPALDTLGDPWLQPLPPIDVPGARISGQLRDLGGCFDLNSLAPAGIADPARIEALQRILIALELDPGIAVEAADWIDHDLEPLPGGAEDGAYLGLVPGWRTGNRAMAHPSEARRLRRVDASAWERLEPHVCALPQPAPLNLNTAPPLLWLSLDARIDLPLARRLARGPDTAYPSMEALRQALEREGLAGVDLSAAGLSTRYYMAEGQIEADGIRFVHSALIERDRGTGEVRVLARARGRL
jgi:general secretion pathway protein K